MTDSRASVIAIDGPSASGKGTVSRLVAQKLGFHLLDSGALYRLVGLGAMQHAIDLDDEPALVSLIRELGIRFVENDGGTETLVYLDGHDVSDTLRSEETGRAASRVAALPDVRRALLDRQRVFRRLPGLVADGRDMGSVVFPDATLKVYLDASPEERAQRRYKQLMEKGMDVNLSALLADIRSRDARDTGRSTAPLAQAAGARLIDSSQMGIEDVVSRILEYWWSLS